MNTEIRRWCDKCKKVVLLNRPDYIQISSNVYRCSFCNSKINIKLREDEING